ncbi:TonB-dependent receptor domain-containing protein [Sphingomonas hengshuiensis]|uniref:TonB-dependent receptor n=1 Tax=Sphingomonas hengshuiensis TaxID=1609977 RepID=A0A7U4JAD6_9SPHN|nr:TonB-dependent receptor [Sphingomonas hengshuiensis]AJP73210.1 TonB-dependent receptor [Sphingomonas hengshuiensis]
MQSSTRSHFARLSRSAAPFALALGSIAPAMAQTAPQVPVAQDAPAADDGAQDQIVVTGSRFRRADTETPSPVTVLTADTLDKAGITTIADAIRSISADSAGSIGTGFQTGFSAGGSAVSLRGLGVSSTLVLIDGLRSTNFPINDDGHNAYVDLNSIPFSLVDRVEVLKDGASSSYGADAIGGVVNIILKKQFTGLEGSIEGGAAEKGDAGHLRAELTAGYGDYEAQGFNIYINGEYQRDGRVLSHDRGFPYNTRDLLAIGGNDGNADDSSLTQNVPTAYVGRVRQNDLNNPLSGATGSPQTSQYTALGLANCSRGTFTVAAGTGCKYDLTDMYRQLQPLQERYSVNGRVSYRVADNIEGYVTGSYSRSYVSIHGIPSAIRQTQPFGASPLTASSNPGIVLPVYICPTGNNCANAATPGRTLNPNNPYASAFANDPSNGAARIYYLFGDIPAGSERNNEVYRAAAGLHGSFEGGWDWSIDGVYARDNLSITQHGLINIAALRTAINTGSYNFVNPSLNTAAVRNALSPDKTTPSYSQMYSLDASITKALAELPGGTLQFAVGGQVRREKLENNNQNAALDTYGLTTASAFGEHTVSAGYFELDAPILNVLDVNASGRYDHYSEGFSHFSPKVGVKFTPIKQIALRGTYSQGFRAPTFAESGPRSQYAGFVTTTPPCAFQIAHGGVASGTGCTTGGNAYNLPYSLGRGVAGNPDLEPETSRSFTAGTILQPVSWLSFTADYYNVKKSKLIIAGPDIGKAVSAYFGAANLAAAQAAVAAVGPGYSVNTVDGADPLFPNALPRVLIINVPYVNANYAITSGIDLAATANIQISPGIKFTSRIEATHTFQYDLHTTTGVQKYAGTLGPYDLSSGNGTPNWRGNWQNTLDFGNFSLSLTSYYVGRIKEVSTDQQTAPFTTDCSASLYRSTDLNKFCYVNSFISNDLNATVRVNDGFTFYVNVKNVLDARAPIAPAAYSSAPNFLTTWHYAGLIGRQFRAGANFRF